MATNVCVGDEVRIRTTVPHWLRTFGQCLDEILIVHDTVPAVGRIARLHGPSNPGDMRQVLDSLTKLDARIRIVELPSPAELRPILRRWFRSGDPIRCQAGTPIAAFVFATEATREQVVLRVDCDMLFVERGWVAKGIEMLSSGTADLIEPPRLGEVGPKHEVSSRVLLVNLPKLRARLPINAHRLDVLRRIHRRLHGRSTWMAFEQMLQKEVISGHMRHVILDPSLGYSMHVSSRLEMNEVADNPTILRAFEESALPPAQNASWNFIPSAWEQVISGHPQQNSPCT